MEAFIEVLTFIVRAGPEATEYGKPFDGAAVGIVDGNKVVLKALTCGPGVMKASHLRAVYEAISRELGITNVTWDRFKL